MSESISLPCPGCGSKKTLGSLHRKRAEVRKRVDEQTRKRYTPPPPPKTGGTMIQPTQILNMSPSSIYLTHNDAHYYDASAGDLQICAADPQDMVGTVKINDAVLDVCIDCGTFYAPNAKQLAGVIEEEIIKMDPLGALAEIRGPSEDQAG